MWENWIFEADNIQVKLIGVGDFNFFGVVGKVD